MKQQRPGIKRRYGIISFKGSTSSLDLSGNSQINFWAMPMDISLFVELSETLTGVRHLPVDLAAAYEARMRAEGLGDGLDRLVSTYSQLKEQDRLDHNSLADGLFADAELRAAAEQLSVLWYTSALMGPAGPAGQTPLSFGKPEHYFRALLWEVIGAHPPALSGGYFGYWHYPPEN